MFKNRNVHKPTIVAVSGYFDSLSPGHVEYFYKAKISQFPIQSGDVPITCADISKDKKLLNYSPKIEIEEGIRNFVQWYRNGEC